MSLKTDLKERFLKLDTLHGIIWVPCGVLEFLAAIFAQQYTIIIAAIAGGSYLFIEGLRKLLGNPAKAKAALTIAAAKYVTPTSAPVDASIPPQ